jgi:hypothetical protein
MAPPSPSPPRRLSPSPPRPSTQPNSFGEPHAAGHSGVSSPYATPASRLNPQVVPFHMLGGSSAKASGKETPEWLQYSVASSAAASSLSSRSVGSSLLPRSPPRASPASYRDAVKRKAPTVESSLWPPASGRGAAARGLHGWRSPCLPHVAGPCTPSSSAALAQGSPPGC